MSPAALRSRRRGRRRRRESRTAAWIGASTPPLRGEASLRAACGFGVNQLLGLTFYCCSGRGGVARLTQLVMTSRSNLFAGARPFVVIAAAAVLAGALGGCAATRQGTGALAAAPVADEDAPAASEAEARRNVATWEERYRANSSDPQVAIHYAQALRVK